MGKSMSIREVVASLREQVPDSGKSARDAEALKIAAEALDRLDRGIPASPVAVAKAFGVTRERIRQLEHRALGKLLFAVSGTHCIDLLRSCAAEIMEREGVGNESR